MRFKRLPAAILFVCMFIANTLSAATYTPNYALKKPAVGESGWLTTFNNDFTAIDAKLWEALNTVPAGSLAYGTSILSEWIADPSITTDQANPLTAKSIAAIIAGVSGADMDLRLPPATYNINRSYMVPSTTRLKPDKGAILKTWFSIREAAYKWTASGSGTSEYYLELAAGGNPGIYEPSTIHANALALDGGTAGSLTASQWDWADNDSLGYSTVYVRLADSADPDGKAAGYVTAGYTLTSNGPFSPVLYQVFDTSGGGSVVFGPGACEYVTAQLWGASPSASSAVNTAAFRAASVCAIASSVPLYIPSVATYYDVDSTVAPIISVVSKRITIQGDGWDWSTGYGSCLRDVGTGTTASFSGTALAEANGSRIDGVSFITSTASIGIHSGDYNIYPLISNSLVQGYTDDLKIGFSWGGRVLNNTFKSATNAGVLATDGVSIHWDFIGNTISYNTYGIMTTKGTAAAWNMLKYSTISGGTISHNIKQGLNLVDTNQLSVRDVYFEQNGRGTDDSGAGNTDNEKATIYLATGVAGCNYSDLTSLGAIGDFVRTDGGYNTFRNLVPNVIDNTHAVVRVLAGLSNRIEASPYIPQRTTGGATNYAYAYPVAASTYTDIVDPLSKCLLHVSGDITVADITNTAVNFNVADNNPVDMWTNGVQNKIYIKTTGTYSVQATTAFNVTAWTGSFITKIVDNAGAILAMSSNTPAASNATRITLGSTVWLNAGQYVQLIVWQGSGGTLDIPSGYTRIAVVKVP